MAHGEGYDYIYDNFKEGFALVKKGDKQFYVNLEELRKTGSSHDYKFDEYRAGFNVVYENGQYYFIDEDFKLHGEGYDDAYNFSEGFAIVKKDGKWYFVDNKDFKLHGEGYDYAYAFKEGFGVVEKDGKWYYVDNKKFELHGEGYDYAESFSEGVARVEKYGKYRYTINKNFEKFCRWEIFYDDENNKKFKNMKRLEEADHLEEVKNDLMSIVGIRAIMFSKEFVKELKAIVLKYFQKEISHIITDEEIEELKSDMEYIKGLIKEKKKQYSQVSPERKRLLKKAKSFFGSVNANKNKPDGNSGNTDENNTDDNSSDEEQK